jgi:general L-amino acid transport system substrate-binding protein
LIRQLCILLVLTIGAGSPALAQSNTLDSVRDRGTLRCGVDVNIAGLARRSENGVWNGLEIDFCRAFAGATLGDSNAVEFVPIQFRDRFPALQSGEVDVLASTSVGTFGRDTAQGIDFVGPYFVETGSILVRSDLGLSRFDQFGSIPVCFVTGTLQETILSDWEAQTGVTLLKVSMPDWDSARAGYRDGRCDGLSNTRTSLLAFRQSLAQPDSHRLIDDAVGIAGLYFGVRHSDDRWEDIIRWTFNTLVLAEEYGITQVNSVRLSQDSQNPVIRRLLSPENNLGEALGLDGEWALQAINAAGNYGEIYSRAFGESTALPIPRDMNRLWTQGGIMYSPPFD